MEKETKVIEINLRDKVDVEYLENTPYSKKGDKTKLHPYAAEKLVDRKLVKIVKEKE